MWCYRETGMRLVAMAEAASSSVWKNEVEAAAEEKIAGGAELWFCSGPRTMTSCG